MPSRLRKYVAWNTAERWNEPGARQSVDLVFRESLHQLASSPERTGHSTGTNSTVPWLRQNLAFAPRCQPGEQSPHLPAYPAHDDRQGGPRLAGFRAIGRALGATGLPFVSGIALARSPPATFGLSGFLNFLTGRLAAAVSGTR